MPTVREVEDLIEEIDGLKRKVSESQGLITHLKKQIEGGDDPEKLNKKLLSLKKQKLDLEKQLQKEYEAYKEAYVKHTE